jgi:hypothetical protein
LNDGSGKIIHPGTRDRGFTVNPEPVIITKNAPTLRSVIYFTITAVCQYQLGTLNAYEEVGSKRNEKVLSTTEEKETEICSPLEIMNI